jgi:hypothetical protein
MLFSTSHIVVCRPRWSARRLWTQLNSFPQLCTHFVLWVVVRDNGRHPEYPRHFTLPLIPYLCTQASTALKQGKFSISPSRKIKYLSLEKQPLYERNGLCSEPNGRQAAFEVRQSTYRLLIQNHSWNFPRPRLKAWIQLPLLLPAMGLVPPPLAPVLPRTRAVA